MKIYRYTLWKSPNTQFYITFNKNVGLAVYQRTGQISLLDSERFHLPRLVVESSPLELLVLTGVTKQQIREYFHEDI